MADHQLPEALRHLAVPIASLHPYPHNPRQGDIGAISQSLQAHNQYRPVVVRRADNTVLAGNHTLAAAKALGWHEIAATFVDVDDDEAARIVIVDNRTSDLASNDPEKLASLLQELAATPAGLDGSGYDGDALDELLADLGQTGPELRGDPDAMPQVPEDPVTLPGDVIVLGPHRIICGDCREPSVVSRLLDGRCANVVITSPPYAAQRDYDQHSGFVPVPPERYVEWYQAVAAMVAAHLAPDGSYFLNIKEHCEDGQRLLYVKDLALAHVRAWGWLFVDEFCWHRKGVPGGWDNRFKNEWEPVFHFARSDALKFRPEAVSHWSERTYEYDPAAPKTPAGFISARRDALGRSTVDREHPGWARPGNHLEIQTGEVHVSARHVATFPVGLPEFFIKAFSDPGDVVFDPFMGSGTTLVAAEQQGRAAYGCEISPAYCDVICQRFKDLTGIEPIRQSPTRDLEMVK